MLCTDLQMSSGGATEVGRAPSAGVLNVWNVRKLFRVRGRRRASVRAVDGVSFSAGPGTTVGVVGESGCGKTTLGRIVAGLARPSEGTVRIASTTGDVEVDPATTRGLVQMIYQSPSDSLDPRLRIGESVEEPLLFVPRGERNSRADEALESVGLGGLRERYPHELSGGQQQRVCIARAIVAHPRVVVLDEAVSALDILLQVEVLTLLGDIQARTDSIFVFISHDLAAVRAVSNYVLVMYLGRVVEVIPSAEFANSPLHPYTVALQSAELIEGASSGHGRIVLAGEPPSATEEYTGCRFAGRCPSVTGRCLESEPPLVNVGGGRSVACYFPGSLGQSSEAIDDSAEGGRK